MIDFLSISKPVHVVTFTVLYLLLVLLTEVLLPLITVLLAPQSSSAALHVSGIFQLLWVVIIGLVICNFIEDVCAVLMGTSIWTILCPVIYALTNCTFYWHSISIGGGFCHGFCRTFGVDGQFSFTLFRLEGLRFGLTFLSTANCIMFLWLRYRFFFSSMQGLVWLPELFILLYKDFLLVWTNNFNVKVILFMVCWLLLDVKRFRVYRGDFILFRKYLDQLGFNNVAA